MASSSSRNTLGRDVYTINAITMILVSGKWLYRVTISPLTDLRTSYEGSGKTIAEACEDALAKAHG